MHNDYFRLFGSISVLFILQKIQSIQIMADLSCLMSTVYAFDTFTNTYNQGYDAACEEGPGIFSHLLTLCSMVLIIATLPASLFFVVKVVQVTMPLLNLIQELLSFTPR